MTGAYAKKLLERPRFGEESHIQALQVCHLVALLTDFRDKGDDLDMSALAGFYSLDELGETGGIPPLEELPEEILEQELDFWETARPWEEQ